MVHQAHQDDSVTVTVTQQIATGRPTSAQASLCGQTANGQTANGRTDENSLTFTFEITSPDLWWPVHQGPQTVRLHGLAFLLCRLVLLEKGGQQVHFFSIAVKYHFETFKVEFSFLMKTLLSPFSCKYCKYAETSRIYLYL